jgi:hypothetical protein
MCVPEPPSRGAEVLIHTTQSCAVAHGHSLFPRVKKGAWRVRLGCVSGSGTWLTHRWPYYPQVPASWSQTPRGVQKRRRLQKKTLWLCAFPIRSASSPWPGDGCRTGLRKQDVAPGLSANVLASDLQHRRHGRGQGKRRFVVPERSGFCKRGDLRV